MDLTDKDGREAGMGSANRAAGAAAPERTKRPACQLYVISPATIDAGFADVLKAAFDGGDVAAFQLRFKGLADDAIARAAEPLQRVCADYGTAFIVNDSAVLAKQLGADGVHLGQSDGDLRSARALLGPDIQIGVTCHDSRHLAMNAGEGGADYVAFGAFYESGTKSTQFSADLELLTWWSTLFELPCVAIGGITALNAAPLVAAGADFIAASGGIWGHSDGPGAGVKAFNALF